jgi:hypothetical protein
LAPLEVERLAWELDVDLEPLLVATEMAGRAARQRAATVVLMFSSGSPPAP